MFSSKSVMRVSLVQKKKIEDSPNLGEEEDRLILITNISNNLLQIAITIIGHIYFTNISGLYL